jgi:hypothetical protein
MGQPRALETRDSAARHNAGDALRRGVKLIGTFCSMKLPHMAVLFRGAEEVINKSGTLSYVSATALASACRQVTGTSPGNVRGNG